MQEEANKRQRDQECNLDLQRAGCGSDGNRCEVTGGVSAVRVLLLKCQITPAVSSLPNKIKEESPELLISCNCLLNS